MTHFPQPHPSRRAPRVTLGGAVAAAVSLDGGQRAKAKLQSLSTTGGLLHMIRPLRSGDFVEVAFDTKSGPVHGMAEMLAARKLAEGCVQPFRFIALSDDDHSRLRNALDSALERNVLGVSGFASAQKF